eukprot:GEMP01023015.1.p1 GENE.GEMP01023015.1~~GEMP01023015.1.p1  ORF type:complete len:460 (+),score=93.99 GEMP01023015.1:55-1434(+)
MGEEARADMLERLITLVKQFYSDEFYLTPFGSAVSKFCSDASDFDLVLLLPDHGADEKGNQIRHQVVIPTLQGITNQLRNQASNNGFRLKEFIRNARVPIVALECGKHKIPADISVNQPFGLLNSWLLRDYAFESVKAMVMKVKEWTKSKGINNARDGYLSSYGWTLFVLGFLMERNLIPRLYHGNAIEENPNPYFDSEEALQIVIGAVESTPDEPRPYLWFPSGDVEPFELTDDILNEWLQYVKEHLDQDTIPIRSRKIVSIRTPGESPWEDVTTYTKKPDHWSGNVYALIEEPFSGENVARVLRVNGAYGIKQEISRAFDVMATGSTFDDVIQLESIAVPPRGVKRPLDTPAGPAAQRLRVNPLNPMRAPYQQQMMNRPGAMPGKGGGNFGMDANRRTQSVPPVQRSWAQQNQQQRLPPQQRTFVPAPYQRFGSSPPAGNSTNGKGMPRPYRPAPRW